VDLILESRARPTKLHLIKESTGLAEAGFYPGVLYLMGSWCTYLDHGISYFVMTLGVKSLTGMILDRKDELAKRASIFGVSGSIATMFSGYLMTAVINLDGRNGIKGWQWSVILSTISRT
jgi:MFS transporter, ACS family, pantothenate transporter